MKLIHGDCLEEMAKLPDNSIDMVLTDPPYGTTACKWDSILPLDPMWEQLKRIIKLNGAIVMTAGQPFTSALIMSNPKMFKYEWVWEKPQATGHLNAKKQPMRSHESIVVFYQRQCTYNPQKTQGHKPMNSGVRRRTHKNHCYNEINKTPLPFGGNTDRYPRTVQIFSGDKQHEYLHPTQKPIELMEYLIKTYTNEGETVLDFTMGSGTTGVAAKNLGRSFVGIEKDDKYFAIAKERINQT